MNPDEMSGWIWVMAAVAGLLLFAFAATLYMIPTLIASRRKTSHRGTIATLNVLTGWTGIGWLGALVWALTDHRYEPVIQYVVTQPPGNQPLR